MTISQHYPTVSTCVAEVLGASDRPLTIDELVARIKDRRPGDDKTGHAVQEAIDDLYQAVQVEPGFFGWLSTLLNNTVYRHPLTGDEVRRGYLLLDELEHAVFFPEFFQNHRRGNRLLSVELYGGPTLQAEAYIERKIWSLRLGVEFSEWVDDVGGQGRDDVIIAAIDAQRGLYSLRLSPREARDEDAVQRRNMDLALQAEAIANARRKEQPVLPTWELVSALIGAGFFADPLPPDDLHYTLHQYSLLQFVDGYGYTIGDTADQPAIPRHDLSRIASFYAPPKTPETGKSNDFSVDELAFPFAAPSPDEFGPSGEEDFCASYAEYLESFFTAQEAGEPLSHDDFHLLEAELETLVVLEQEFGRLMDEQTRRKDALVERIFIDPASFLGNDMDMFGGGYDEPPFWEN